MKFHKLHQVAYIHNCVNIPKDHPKTLIFEQLCAEPITEMVLNNWSFSEYVSHNYALFRSEIAEEATNDICNGIDVIANVNGRKVGINSKGSRKKTICLKKTDIEHIINGDISYISIIRFSTSSLYLIDCNILTKSNYWNPALDKIIIEIDKLLLLSPIIYGIPKYLRDYYKACYDICTAMNDDDAIHNIAQLFSNTFNYTLMSIDVIKDYELNKCVPKIYN